MMKLQRITAYLKKEYSLDLRSLALMRILIAAVLILDILIRLTDLKAHYTDDGILPLKILFQYTWNQWLFSFHTISSNIYFQGSLFIIQIAAAVALLAGYRTKAATILSWILLLSVHNRNPVILQGGDDLLRMILFWGMFIPWGAYYSYDSQRSPHREHMHFSAATMGYLFQVAAVYFFSALLKTSPEWRSESTALYYALSLDQLVMPAGQLIYPYFQLMKVMTFIVYRIELWVPAILFFPVFNRSFRNIAAVTFIILHAGIGMTLFVGLFFLIGIASSVGFLSGCYMDRVHHWLAMRFKFNDNDLDIAKPLQPGIQLSLSLVLIYIVVWNFDTTSVIRFNIPKDLKAPGYALRINQNWGMFAPGVFKDDGWYIYEGTPSNNNESVIDLNRFGRKVTYEKPSHIVSMYRNDRWRKFSENFLFVNNGYLRPYYASYLLNEWNATHPGNKINALRIVYMKEVTGPFYKHAKPKREILTEFKP